MRGRMRRRRNLPIAYLFVDPDAPHKQAVIDAPGVLAGVHIHPAGEILPVEKIAPLRHVIGESGGGEEKREKEVFHGVTITARPGRASFTRRSATTRKCAGRPDVIMTHALAY